MKTHLKHNVSKETSVLPVAVGAPPSPWQLRQKPQETSLAPFLPFCPTTNPSANCPIVSTVTTSIPIYHLLSHKWNPYLVSCSPAVQEARVISSKHGLGSALTLLKTTVASHGCPQKQVSSARADLTWPRPLPWSVYSSH